MLSYLEENFSDHELTPTRIDRRLKAGREDLLDSAMSTLTICEIAYRRGFNDSAHFSRAFKERFGLSPGSLRVKGGATAERGSAAGLGRSFPRRA
ncbi:MAG: helix-turn-helix domain-containing protein [Rhodocyclaceae bacterium]|nr:helix-turn-helix domain-containing protein [Rhodocyclaceae bacterium]